MKLSTIALAAAALIALPAASYAQTTPAQEKHQTGRDDAQSNSNPTAQDVKSAAGQKKGVKAKGSSGSSMNQDNEKGTTGTGGSGQEDKKRGRNSPAEPTTKQ